ncbi:M20 metallopeptidase family protein [Propioniciclava tarda]|uniref:Amidohydrolase n=1 Tax=Propioniciclava tarda TaxID=433330 RepID=A0A4Q9KKJ9_PROTD|nr:M20 family metallopeptidase [Propioniciclava tarda]TBT94983.1 amidohydrolase [Propioniciclava tarda]SMO57388.1 hippurate hydrolase [Propioniciclava tarda]
MIDAHALSLDVLDFVTELRHDLHAHPELGTDLPVTQRRVLDALAGLPLEITLGRQLTSVTAVLRGGKADADLARRPIILLRGDMDALPVRENTGQPFASTIDGRMHACGHDLHTATLAGAAKALCTIKDELPGDIVFMFQPAEEVLVSGAQLMIDEGVLDAAGRRVDRAFGLHATSAMIPTGHWWTRPGTIMAGTNNMLVDIIGRGGHGSTPWGSNDPVPVMAEIITSLQTVATRKFSVFDPVVITVGVATAGQAPNVIPERCHLEASVRTLSKESLATASIVFPQVVRQIADAHGCRAEVDWQPGFPPTVNDPDAAAFILAELSDLFGADRVASMDVPLMGSEDFSKVLDAVPGAFVFYSAVPPTARLEDATFNHSETATFDDSALAGAVAAFVRIATASLRELSTTRG